MMAFDMEWGGGKVCVSYEEDHGEIGDFTVELYTPTGMQDITRDLTRLEREIVIAAIWSDDEWGE